MAGRKLVDLDGPHGWRKAAVNLGRVSPHARASDTSTGRDTLAEGVSVGIRLVQPLIELRTTFELSMRELDNIGRGAADLSLDPVMAAAERTARAEDHAIFDGFTPARIAGIARSSPHAALPIPSSATEYPHVIAEALEVLRRSGISGPIALALGSRCFSELSQAAEDGYPIRKRIEQQLIDGPIVWAPTVDGAVVLSTRGGDFVLTVGQDISIGYDWHDKESIALFLTESFTFRLLEPAAAVVLTYDKTRR
jgi:uncharacterized linocin/CFP29 family protein